LLVLQWAFWFSLWPPAWDGAFYYNLSRSLVFDGDLHLENDFLLSYPGAAPDYVAKNLHKQLTETGRVQFPFAPGTSFFWAPALALLRAGTALWYHITGNSAAITGYEWWFTGMAGLFSMLAGWIAFGLIWQMVQQRHGKRTAFLTMLAFLFATPLVYYLYREPHYSHGVSALTTTLVVWQWWRNHQKPPRWQDGLVLGALVGMASLVRWQHVTLAILPVVSMLLWWLDRPKTERRTAWRAPLHYLLAAGIASLVLFMPQLWLWHLFYGTWLTVPQGEAFMQWDAAWLRPILFSTYRGLFLWMPAAFFGMAGLLVFGRKEPRFQIPLLAAFLLSLYVNASTPDWFGGGGYGPRRFVSELAIFMPGYGLLLARITQRPRQIAVGSGLALLLALHQLILLRHGLPDRIGGHNLSMYPDFRWTEWPVSQFFSALWQYAPQFWQNPADLLILHNSPLHTLLHQGITATLPSLALFALTSLLVLLPAAVTLRFVSLQRKR
jgi:hypothetical protein